MTEELSTSSGVGGHDHGIGGSSRAHVSRDVFAIREGVQTAHLLAFESGWIRAGDVDAWDRGIVDPQGLQVYAEDVADWLGQALRRKERSLAELAGRRAASGGVSTVDDITFVTREGRLTLQNSGTLRELSALTSTANPQSTTCPTVLRGEYECSFDYDQLLALIETPIPRRGEKRVRTPLSESDRAVAIANFRTRYTQSLVRMRFHARATPGLAFEWIGVIGRAKLVGDGPGAVFRITIEVPVAAELPLGEIQVERVFLSFLEPRAKADLKEWLRLFDSTIAMTPDHAAKRESFTGKTSFWARIARQCETATGPAAFPYFDPSTLLPALDRYEELRLLSRALPFEDGIRVAVADRVAMLIESIVLSEECFIQDVKEDLHLGERVESEEPDRQDAIEVRKVVAPQTNAAIWQLIHELMEPTKVLPEARGAFFALFKEVRKGVKSGEDRRAAAAKRGGKAGPKSSLSETGLE